MATRLPSRDVACAPASPHAIPGLDVAVRYLPGDTAAGVGGDFFDVFRVAANDWAVVLGDVCGRGASAASLTGLARDAVRAAAERHFLPSDLLAELNHAMLAAAGARDDHFCSAVIGRVELDVCGAWLTLAAAGHPRPVLLRSAGWMEVRGHPGVPPGMFADFAAVNDRVGLGPGDALVFYTDGLSEARSPVGTLFGDEAVGRALLELAGAPADDIADGALAAARRFAGMRLRDDVAVLVVAVPPDAVELGIGRVATATGIPVRQLRLPAYPHGDEQPEDWRRVDPPREARRRLRPHPAANGEARAFVRKMLATWGMDDVIGDDVEQVISALVTNAIQHARPPLSAGVEYRPGLVRLTVDDGSTLWPAVAHGEVDALCGRGLMIVEALAARWGVMPMPAGKRVWAELPVGGRPRSGGRER